VAAGFVGAVSLPAVVRAVLRYEAYEAYPYVCYVGLDMKVYDSPVRGAVEVASWIIPFSDGVGLVVHRVAGFDSVAVRAYELGEGVVENSDLVPRLVERVVRFLESPDFRLFRLLRVNKHVVEGVAVLAGLEVGDVEAVFREAELREEMEDKVAAVFGDTVLVLSKRRFAARFDGSDAVEVARKYAFIVDAPVSYIAEKHVQPALGRQTTIYIFSDTSVICNPHTCHVLPLPSNIAYLVGKRAGSVIVDLEKRKPEEYRGVKLHTPPICMWRNRLLLLSSEGGKLAVTGSRRLPVRVPEPLVFTGDGFAGYAKFTASAGKVYVEAREVKQRRERGEEGGEEEERYLGEIVLGG